MKEVLSAGLVAFLHAVSIFAQQGGTPLRLVATIPLPNVEGRIDHFGVDLQGRRLFMSALGNNTVEVFDLKTNQRLHPRAMEIELELNIPRPQTRQEYDRQNSQTQPQRRALHHLGGSDLDRRRE